MRRRASERAHGLNTVASHVDCKKLGSNPSSSTMASADSSPSWRRTWRRLRKLRILSLSLSLHLSHVLSGVPPDRNFFGFLMSLALHANHMLVVSPRVLFRGPKANVDLNFMFIFVMTCSLYYPSEYISDHSQLNSNPIMGTWSSNVDGDVDIWKAMVKVQPRPRSCHLSMTCIRPMWLMTRKSVKKSFGLSTRGLGLRFLDNGQPNHLVVNHHDFVFYVFSCDELPCLSLNGWLPWCFFVLLESKCLLVFLCPWPPMRFH